MSNVGGVLGRRVCETDSISVSSKDFMEPHITGIEFSLYVLEDRMHGYDYAFSKQIHSDDMPIDLVVPTIKTPGTAIAGFQPC